MAAANKVEQDFALGQLDLPVEPLKESETFLCVERALLVHVESELLKAATPALLQLAEYRLSRFWADVIPAIQARWALISSAAEVLIEADRVGKATQDGADYSSGPGQSVCRRRRAVVLARHASPAHGEP